MFELLLATALQITIEDPTNIRINRVFIGAAWGAIYNASRYTDKAANLDGERWQWGKARRTVMLGLVAGIIVGITDPDAVGGGNFEAAMYAMVPVANEVLGAVGKARDNLEMALREETGYGSDANSQAAANRQQKPQTEPKPQQQSINEHRDQLTGSNPIPESELEQIKPTPTETETQPQTQAQEPEPAAASSSDPAGLAMAADDGPDHDSDSDSDTTQSGADNAESEGDPESDDDVDQSRREAFDPRNWLVDLTNAEQSATQTDQPACEHDASECDCGAHASAEAELDDYERDPRL